MHEFSVYNYEIIPAENALINAASNSAFYGRGIFTTVAIYNSKPFLWEKHWRRLTANAEKIAVSLAEFPEQKIENSLFRIIAENKIKNGRARLTFFDESASPIWQTKQKSRMGFLINTADFRKILDDFRLTISPFRINSTSPLVNVKSCNYLEHILALEAAKTNGFNEAVRINERGEIASACMANIFWLKNDKIFTPELKTGCLAGTTREFLLENYSIREITAKSEKLYEADAVFLTSAGLGIVQVAEFQENKFSRKRHEFMEILKIRTDRNGI